MEKAKAEGMSQGPALLVPPPAHLWTAQGACLCFPNSDEPVCTWGSGFVHATTLSKDKLIFSP